MLFPRVPERSSAYSTAGASTTPIEADTRASTSNTPQLPSIALPNGGGAVRGIDEKLTVGLATGAAQLTVPLPTTSIPQRFSPTLTLAYDSGAGNGAFGLGWRISTPSISRKTAKGLPRYRDADDSDVFVLSDAEDLVPFTGAPLPDATGEFEVRRYRPRVEAGFARIERWRSLSSGDVHWRTTSRDNVVTIFGADGASRIADPGDHAHVFTWLASFSFDDRGNAVAYEHKGEDDVGVPRAVYERGRAASANRYLKCVRYGNSTPYDPEPDAAPPADWRFKVVLDYGDHDPAAPQPVESQPWPSRVDPFSSFRSGFEIRTRRLCRRVLLFHSFPDELGAPDVLVRSTDLGYSTDSPADAALPSYAQLTAIEQVGYIRDPGTGAYNRKALPTLRLGYSPVDVHDDVSVADDDALANLPVGVDGSRWRWLDLDGEGTKGVLADNDDAWYYKRNVSAYAPNGSQVVARFEPLEVVAAKPIGATGGRSPQLLDLHGDGQLCAVELSPPTAGYHERRDNDWGPFVPLDTAALDWSSPNVRMIDLDGDGLADVLLTEDDAFTWYRWGDNDGFSTPERVVAPRDEDVGPALVFAEGDTSVFLADMSGDGLSDLVRIRNGEVCYWPNVGHGRFGAKVTMDGAPWFDDAETFDATRLQLADLDGSGTADMVYVAGSATIWFNQSGNAFTAATELAGFPSLDDVSSVTAVDLLGSGTTCLTWSAPLPDDAAGRQLRYVDLMGGLKPYLLTTVANNIGAESTLTYATSTRFYIQDRLAGKTWATKLAFPVHVVERHEVRDLVTGTDLLRTYSYHHGYFDGVEREFRGFAMVEQRDAEMLPAASGTGSFTSAPPIVSEEFVLPPVRTRSWFHTGAFVDGRDMADVVSREYFAGDTHAAPLPGTSFVGATTAEEMREACRALRGRPLRTEVYADDGSPEADIPYSVTAYRHQVHTLQAPAGASYGSAYACDLETLTLHYERNATDPRVTHDLVLEVDAFGALSKSARVAYARRAAGVVPEQDVALFTYVEHDVVNVDQAADRYQLGVPVETRTYELSGLGSPSDATRTDPDALLARALAAAPIPFEGAPDGSLQRRLVGRTRTVYVADDLSGALPPGSVGAPALVHRTHALTVTSGLAASVYASKLADPAVVATSDGGFVDLDGDGNWWAPSARTFYSTDPDHPDLASARAHFYLPQGSVDPFGGTTHIGWEHDVAVARTTDAVGNVTSASVNYRVLQPWLVTDPNLNRTGARFDELGMVTARAVLGKALQGAGGDEGDHLDLAGAEASADDDPTQRFDYDLDAYRTWADNPLRDPEHPVPVSAHTSARVLHRDPASPWLQRVVYGDGLGRTVLSKAQAEAGDAPVVGPDGSLSFVSTESRWVGTGRVVFDNKGNPVKAYEPFFAADQNYASEPALVEWGVTSITRYDPLGRVVRVDKPDGSFTSVEFDAWRGTAADENDNVLASSWYAARVGGALGADEQDAAIKAAAHAATPRVMDADPLGRTRRVIDDGPTGGHVMRFSIDILGRTVATTDPLHRVAALTDYDVTGATIHSVSIDAGERWTLRDCAGKPLREWDSRGVQIRHVYDAARRPTELHVTLSGGGEVLPETITYGEGLPDGRARNALGAVYERRDSAGVLTIEQRDFKGNTTQISRRMLVDPRAEVDWSTAPALSGETLATVTTYDALDRVVTIASPDASVTTRSYNERSLVDAVSVGLRGGDPALYLPTATYDAKSRPLAVTRANGATTSYAYDAETFRLRNLTTTRPTTANPVQDLSYTYDPIGNLTRIVDGAQSTVFFANQLVAPVGEYTYDAVYELVAAAGREHVALNAGAPATWDDGSRRAVPLPADTQAMQNYTESYTYDLAGNLARLEHHAAGGNWTRAYDYGIAANNRLVASTVGALDESYAYDLNGNVTSMPHLSQLGWDFKNRLEMTAQQVVNGADPETTWYRYDSSAGRVRKATVRPDGSVAHERIYQGNYGIYREHSPAGAITLERQTLAVDDGTGRLVLIETTTIDADKPGAEPESVFRYQLGNHLGSACVELNETAAVITYEEYYPYGATSFQAGRSVAEVSLKRYHFCGKERDDESALGYHGARYYVPWLGRWTTPDPAGLADAPSLYVYCRGNPIVLHDPAGRQSHSGQQETDDSSRFHYEVVPRPPDHPGPRLRLVREGPTFAPFIPPFPPLQPPRSAPPTPPPADPQPINPAQQYQPAPTADPWHGSAAGIFGISTVGAGSSALGYAFALGLPKPGPVNLEISAGIAGTGGTDLTLTGGTLTIGPHATWTPAGSRSNLTAYLLGSQTFGQNPPQAGGANFGLGLTLGYEYHHGGLDNDRPLLAVGGNVSGGVGQFNAFAPVTGNASLPTGFASPGYALGGVVNATLTPWYYAQSGADHGFSKIPTYAFLAEVYLGFTGGPATAGAGGSSVVHGGNLGALRNFRVDGGHSVVSVGATAGVRTETDHIGTSSVSATGFVFSLTAGAAF